MATSDLSKKDISRLIQLAHNARRAKKVAREAGVTRVAKKQAWDQWYRMLQKENKEAAKAYREFYESFGLLKQQAWQVERIAQGLCRQCGQESNGDSYCPKCRKSGINRFTIQRKKKQ